MTSDPPNPNVLDLIALLEQPTPDEARTARVAAARATLGGRAVPDDYREWTIDDLLEAIKDIP